MDSNNEVLTRSNLFATTGIILFLSNCIDHKDILFNLIMSLRATTLAAKSAAGERVISIFEKPFYSSAKGYNCYVK